MEQGKEAMEDLEREGGGFETKPAALEEEASLVSGASRPCATGWCHELKRGSCSFSSGRAVAAVFLLLFFGALIFSRCINVSTFEISLASQSSLQSAGNSEDHIPFSFPPFICPPNSSKETTTLTCPSVAAPKPSVDTEQSSTAICPDYFRWIHEDLAPWKETGITVDMVEKARRTAHLRVVVIDGRVYLDWYKKSVETRDVFTVWSILQLLRRYPGRLPDLDLMFDCDDRPNVVARDYDSVAAKSNSALAPPPLFRYCGDERTLDIVFPDWSFWGWAEINIKPWVPLAKELKEGNRRVAWEKREPFAYWKGNPDVASIRRDLLKCNVSDKQDWNARLFINNWESERKRGFKESKLADQCTYRYKIYIEGWAWSVSEKYILACDSPALLVTPVYYDFFTRGLMPLQHYWPVKIEDKCNSINFAVDWGNTHKDEAQAMGKAGSDFIMDKLKMDYVYDYMFHLLDGYGKLMKYKPTRPPTAVEICSESMACRRTGRERMFMVESMVNFSHLSSPCTLPPPYGPVEMNSLLSRRADAITQVEGWKQKSMEGKKN